MHANNRSDMYTFVGSRMMQFYSQCNKLFCWILKMQRARPWWSDHAWSLRHAWSDMFHVHVWCSIDSKFLIGWHLKGHAVFFFLHPSFWDRTLSVWASAFIFSEFEVVIVLKILGLSLVYAAHAGQSQYSCTVLYASIFVHSLLFRFWRITV